MDCLSGTEAGTWECTYVSHAQLPPRRCRPLLSAPCSQEEEEPTSKEGSAPDNGNGHGSKGNGSNGSKEGNGTSR